MRLSNKKKFPLYNFMMTLLFIFFIGCVLLYFVERYKMDFLGKESIFLLITPVVCSTFFWFRGNQIFEYDSDGEALNFSSFNVLPFYKNIKRDEFPKYKLLKYEVVNLFFIKRLYITVCSKKAQSMILNYDISYLTSKEIQDLKTSLEKIVKHNSENPTHI